MKKTAKRKSVIIFKVLTDLAPREDTMRLLSQPWWCGQRNPTDCHHLNHTGCGRHNTDRRRNCRHYNHTGCGCHKTLIAVITRRICGSNCCRYNGDAANASLQIGAAITAIEKAEFRRYYADCSHHKAQLQQQLPSLQDAIAAVTTLFAAVTTILVVAVTRRWLLPSQGAEFRRFSADCLRNYFHYKMQMPPAQHICCC